MRSHTHLILAMPALALAAGLALTGAPAFAQRGDSARQSDDALEQITVVAPRVMRTQVRERTPYGVARYDVMTLTHHISYADLDLAQPDGAKALQRRIRATANELCGQLANAPPAEPRSMECVNNAVKSAMKQARAAIAAAKK